MARTRRGDVAPLPPGPGVRGSFAFLGAAMRGDMLDFFASTLERYGPVASFPLGPQRIVVVDDPPLIEEILVKRQHAFVRDTGATLLRELVGDGLLTTEDPVHLERRRLMQPAFHRARVGAYARTIVAETDRVIDGWDPARPFDLGGAMADLTLGAVGAALFGADLRDEAAAIANVLARVTRRGASLALLLALAGPLLGPLRRRFPRRASFLFPRERAALERIVAPLVARERARAPGDDLLALLLDARDEHGGALDDEAVRNEVCMLVLAGHETTANALTWTWVLLAQHPDIERRVHRTVDAALGGRAPTLADLPALEYVAQVFDETLRLYPSASAFARRPLETLELGGYRIPRGASVFVSPYLTQRSARHFARPLDFVPERWAGVAPPKFAYFPFGGGSKMCLGEPFAKLEAVLAIARIASRYRLERIERGPIARAPSALLKPARPVVVRAVAR